MNITFPKSLYSEVHSDASYISILEIYLFIVWETDDFSFIQISLHSCACYVYCFHDTMNKIDLKLSISFTPLEIAKC